MDRPNAELQLQPLKTFQRRTVDYVFRRLYREGGKRFLVADEVGLGKTLVARGVIARAIEELWPRLDELKRIDIVYICSNGDIARQNINRLNVFNGEHGDSNHLSFATRLTMLPLYLNKLDENPVNFISFTPGTSFNLQSSGGIGDERAMLFKMLAAPWDFSRDRRRRKAASYIFRLGIDKKNWPGYLNRAARVIKERGGIAPALMKAFLAELEGKSGIREYFEQLVHAFMSQESINESRIRFLGNIRRSLALVCVRRLEPDLVILDEFQRFKNLLDGEDDAASLAQELLSYRDECTDTKVILLSATPYRLYTTHNTNGTESHHEDLLRTVEFLLESKAARDQFEQDLRAYGEDLFQAAAAGRKVRPELVATLEQRLRRVMVRTERLGASGNRGGMLTSGIVTTTELAAEDLEQFALVDSAANVLNTGEPIEYWKSAPFLLNLMDHHGYRLKERFLAEIRTELNGALLAQAIKAGAQALIDWSDIERYGALPASNARLRSLTMLAQPDGATSMLWIPPALPYYRTSEGPYSRPLLGDLSKVLVFSSWLIVPKVISMLISYEAERCMVKGRRETGRTYGYSDYSDRARLLEFRMSEGRREQMTHMTLLYPCLTLASCIDPASFYGSDADGGQITDKEALTLATERVQELIAGIVPFRSDDGGPEDQRWYWAVLALLDRKEDCVKSWLATRNDKIAWDKMVEARQNEGNFATYVSNFHQIINGQNIDELGRPPSDLPEIVARIALSSPAVTALRAILRAAGNPEDPKERMHFLAGAARIALGFRSLFNMPMVTAMVRREHPTDERGYWRSVLAYSLGGNLQAVLDEYCHVLRGALGMLDQEPSVVANGLATEIAAAVSLRTVNLELDEIAVDDASGRVHLGDRRRSIRCRYAMRFGDGRSDHEGGGLEPQETRKEQVRQAFNSPFWPFVLTTTSIGQEGLDFHQYCRHIMHWNLPGNPVDIEQREGRIHRYKGHAVRLSVADYLSSGGSLSGIDPLTDVWETLFRQVKEVIGDEEELIPYWLIPDGKYQIERHVPLYPLSREHARFEDLKQKLALYRLAFGQPRQEDLLTYLQNRSTTTAESGFEPVFIDLSPREG